MPHAAEYDERGTPDVNERLLHTANRAALEAADPSENTLMAVNTPTNIEMTAKATVSKVGTGGR